ncbi:MAG: hypothetical protein IJT49_02950 [Clostridia bacterium]|nr:hypothetical protein [Clostridia bacterium]
MIIKPKNTTVAYRCPTCGQAVKSMVGVFALSGDMIKLKCPKFDSEMKMTYTSDGKIRLSVPCFVCGTDHEFILSKQSVLERPLTLLACPMSGMDICFTGTKENVEEQLERAEKELYDLLQENDALDYFDNDEEEYTGRVAPDLSLLPMISTVTKELMCDGRIYCDCAEKQDNELSKGDVNNMLLLGGEPENNCSGDIELVVRYDCFALRCCRCGCEYKITEDNFDRFCEADEITLMRKNTKN